MKNIGEKLTQLATTQQEWSEKTFGTMEMRGPIGALKHLKKEAEETAEDPSDLKEFADILILWLDASWRAGHSIEAIIDAGLAKMVENKARKWPAPKPGNEPVEHDRSEETPKPLIAAAAIAFGQLMRCKAESDGKFGGASTAGFTTGEIEFEVRIQEKRKGFSFVENDDDPEPEFVTDKTVVERCNALARMFYRSNGYVVDEGYRFDKATHPQERGAWNMAAIAYETIEGTDAEAALAALEDEGEES